MFAAIHSAGSQAHGPSTYGRASNWESESKGETVRTMEGVQNETNLARGIKELALHVKGLIARIEHDLGVQPIPRKDLLTALGELDKVFDRIQIRGGLYAIGLASQNDLLNFPRDAYPGQTVADSISKLVDARK